MDQWVGRTKPLRQGLGRNQTSDQSQRLPPQGFFQLQGLHPTRLHRRTPHRWTMQDQLQGLYPTRLHRWTTPDPREFQLCGHTKRRRLQSDLKLSRTEVGHLSRPCLILVRHTDHGHSIGDKKMEVGQQMKVGPIPVQFLILKLWTSWTDLYENETLAGQTMWLKLRRTSINFQDGNFWLRTFLVGHQVLPVEVSSRCRRTSV